MPRKKSIVNVEEQRVRLQNELSRQYRAAQERYFNGGQNAADLKRMETVERRSVTVNRRSVRHRKLVLWRPSFDNSKSITPDIHGTCQRLTIGSERLITACSHNRNK